MNLTGKVALVTGASKRVGRAIALELARAGYDIAIHFRSSSSEAESLADVIKRMNRRTALIRADLNDSTTWPDIIARSVKELGRLDILVNNAAGFEAENPDTIESFDPALWETMLRVNLIAPAALAHYAHPHLIKHGQGKIINLVDIAAERPWATNIAYGASKAGLVALTKSLARALAPTVQVNGVAPGIAVFPEAYDEEQKKKLINRVPLKRAGTPEEVAALVRFLVEEADYMTGQIVALDGGRSIV